MTKKNDPRGSFFIAKKMMGLYTYRMRVVIFTSGGILVGLLITYTLLIVPSRDIFTVLLKILGPTIFFGSLGALLGITSKGPMNKEAFLDGFKIVIIQLGITLLIFNSLVIYLWGGSIEGCFRSEISLACIPILTMGFLIINLFFISWLRYRRNKDFRRGFSFGNVLGFLLLGFLNFLVVYLNL